MEWPASLRNQEWITCQQLGNFVREYASIEIFCDRDRNRFWHEVYQIHMVGCHLQGDVNIKYIGLQSEKFDALFLVDGVEYKAECATVDDVGRYYQYKLIEKITEQDGGYSPLRIVPNNSGKKVKFNIVDDEGVPSVEDRLSYLMRKICSELYDKTSSTLSHDYPFAWLILSTLDLPFCDKSMSKSFRPCIFSLIRCLSEGFGLRIFFVGKNYVLDSEQRLP